MLSSVAILDVICFFAVFQHHVRRPWRGLRVDPIQSAGINELGQAE